MVVPGAPAPDLDARVRRVHHIGGILVEVRRIPIFHPFPDIATHVVQTIGIGFAGLHVLHMAQRRVRTGVIPHPAAAVAVNGTVAGGIGKPAPALGGILELPPFSGVLTACDGEFHLGGAFVVHG